MGEKGIALRSLCVLRKRLHRGEQLHEIGEKFDIVAVVLRFRDDVAGSDEGRIAAGRLFDRKLRVGDA